VRKILFLFFLISLAQLIFPLLRTWQDGIYLPDFVLYYQVGQNLSKGINPYNLSYPLGYSPPALLFFRLLPLIPLNLAQIGWTIISLICLVLSVLLFVKSWDGRLLVLGLSFLAFPTKFTLGMGQINLIILLLIVLVMVFSEQKKSTLAGICLALSILLKTVPLFLVIYFLIKKNFKVLFWLSLTILVAWTLSFGFLGRQINSQYLTQVVPVLASSGLGNTFYYNQSLVGTIGRLGLGKVVFWLAAGTIIIITFIKVYFYRFRVKPGMTRKTNRDLSLVLAANILLSPITWQHHLVWLLPCFVVANKNKKGLSSVLVLVAAYFLTAFNIKNPFPLMASWWGNILLSHGTLGTLVVWLALL
jgi:alpha-1,2-mannosyltransferase